MNIFFTGPIETNNGIIKNSSITNTDIDMNDKKITSLADPTSPQDAVNLRTLNNNIVSLNVILTGTGSVLISNALYGSFIIIVTGDSDNLATAVFSISKSNSSFNITANRLSHSGTGELEVYWNSSSGIYIKKNSITQNGNYIIKII